MLNYFCLSVGVRGVFLTMSSPMPSLSQWLESILLPQYLGLLVENGYDSVQKCSTLTSAELDRIGISLPGHKKRILTHLLMSNKNSDNAGLSINKQIPPVPLSLLLPPSSGSSELPPQETAAHNEVGLQQNGHVELATRTAAEHCPDVSDRHVFV